jgi:high-affinity K+ transport system ATPase subunit B
VEGDPGRVQELTPGADQNQSVRGRGRLVTLYTATVAVGVQLTIVVWLWLTVLFANLAEAVAEGRGKARAETLRRAKRDGPAARVLAAGIDPFGLREESVAGTALQLGDYVVVEAPGHPRRRGRGRGIASVDSRLTASPPRSSGESAATGPRSPAALRCCPTGS